MYWSILYNAWNTRSTYSLRETTLCSRLYIISKENVSAWFSFYNNLSCFESFDALGSKLSCRSSSLRTYAVWLCQTAYFQHAVPIKRHLWNASLCASNFIPQRIHFSSGCRCERCDKKSRDISLCIYTLHHKWNDVFPHIYILSTDFCHLSHIIFLYLYVCSRHGLFLVRKSRDQTTSVGVDG